MSPFEWSWEPPDLDLVCYTSSQPLIHHQGGSGLILCPSLKGSSRVRERLDKGDLVSKLRSHMAMSSPKWAMCVETVGRLWGSEN